MRVWGHCGRWICILVVTAATGGCGRPTPDVFDPRGGGVLDGLSVSRGGACSLDSVGRVGATDKVFHAPADGEALFSGWAWMEQAATAPVEYVAVRLVSETGGNSAVAYTSSTGERPDVASVLGIPPDSKVGFELAGKGLPAMKGSYKVELLLIAGRSVTVCDVDTTLRLD